MVIGDVIVNEFASAENPVRVGVVMAFASGKAILTNGKDWWMSAKNQSGLICVSNAEILSICERAVEQTLALDTAMPSEDGKILYK